MFEIYERAGRDVGYWAGRYLQMLRGRGGLETARHLLKAPVTSTGYERLREAGRLDLTVESLVLQPEFAILFGESEVTRARERLDKFQAMPLPRDLEPSEELTHLVEEAYAASPDEWVGLFRDRVADFGPSAATAVIRAVEAGASAGFAITVIERIGAKDRDRALVALRRIQAVAPGWKPAADDALARLRRQIP